MKYYLCQCTAFPYVTASRMYHDGNQATRVVNITDTQWQHIHEHLTRVRVLLLQEDANLTFATATAEQQPRSSTTSQEHDLLQERNIDETMSILKMNYLVYG